MAGKTFGLPLYPLYDADMATTELLGLEETRKDFRARVTVAEKEETHTVVTLYGSPAAVLVDIEWYRRAREALGDPTDLRVRRKPEAGRPDEVVAE